MKFAFEEEDSLYGILVGAFLIGVSGLWFTIPLSKGILRWIGIAVFGIAIILTFLDIIHTIQDLTYHPLMLIGMFLQSIVDIILEFALLITFLGVKLALPYFTDYVIPLTQTPKGLF